MHQSCPRCNEGDVVNRIPDAVDEEGLYWWACHNDQCPIDYYEPVSGTVR